MSLAIERIELEIEPSKCTRGGTMAACMIFESGDHRRPTEPVMEIKKEEEEDWCCSSSTSSSIGRNSDDDNNNNEENGGISRSRSRSGSGSGSDGEENEVQSTYKGPLEMMEALEEVLPIRKGISRFYNGKSKSFTSLADATSSSSIKDVAKAENAYTRRRRNVIAFNHIWDKNRNFPHKSNGGGISKRLISSSRSTLALAVAMSSSESISNISEDSNSNSNSSSRSRSPPPLPPLHPRGSHNNIAFSSSPHRNVSAWRSFSVADLQQCATANSYDSSNGEKKLII